MRMMMILMMLALPAMAAKAEDAEESLLRDGITLMTAGIHCPSDTLPSHRDVGWIMQQYFEATGSTPQTSAILVSHMMASLTADPPFTTEEEIETCQQLAMQAGPDSFHRRVLDFAAR